jgi:hypothetical protein
MTTSTLRATATASGPFSFDRVAATCAVLAGLSAISYSLSFRVFQNAGSAGFFLMFGGLMATAIVVALYERVRTTEPGFALLGLMLGAAASLGAVVHGGFDLANAIHPPSIPIAADLPSTVDPRGLLVFGVRAAWVMLLVSLAARYRALSSWTIRFGYAAAVLSLTLYLGRLIILDPSNTAIARPALLNGFFVNPVFLFLLAKDLGTSTQR